MVNANTKLAFQQFVQVKSLEGEITCCTEASNFISSQEQMGAEYQIAATLFLPKNCIMLDLQSLEANSVKDLVISQTHLVNQKQTKPFVRKSRESSYNRNDKNTKRREDKSWTKSPERRRWDKKDQFDKFHDKKGTISDQEASQMVQQDHTVTLEEVQAEEEKLTEGTTKEEEKITETTGRTTSQIAQTDKEGEAVETKEVISALRAV